MQIIVYCLLGSCVLVSGDYSSYAGLAFCEVRSGNHRVSVVYDLDGTCLYETIQFD